MSRQLLALILCFNFQTVSAFHIVIDPGHGGTDNGAIYFGKREADITLQVAQELTQLIHKNDQFQVSMTRSYDQQLSLEQRVDFAAQKNADLFISIHANAANSSKAKGTQVYFQNSLPPDEDSLYLANVENQNTIKELRQNQFQNEPSKKADIHSIIEDLQRQSRLHFSFRLAQNLAKNWKNENSIRQAPFFVITKNQMPAVLVEMGFLSNPEEAKKLSLPGYQKDIAKKIYTAILQYKDSVDKSPIKNLN